MTSLLDRILRRPATDLENLMSTEIATVDEKPAPRILMQFLTQGGATVDLYEHAWTVHQYGGGEQREPLRRSGIQWVCQGCDQAGKDHSLGWGYVETEPHYSREAANAHAAECRPCRSPRSDSPFPPDSAPLCRKDCTS